VNKFGSASKPVVTQVPGTYVNYFIKECGAGPQYVASLIQG